ncbi:MAG: cation:proton antiporter [Candidatus Entotheonellia bacterium]
MEHPPLRIAPTKFWTTGVYCVMVLSTIGLFLLIRRYGELLTAPAPLEPLPLRHANTPPQVDVFWHILLVLVVVIVTGQVIGKLFLFLQQPPVIGEVVAGILLGPSFLGRLAPEVSTYLLPPAVAPFLGVIAQLGVILYMFMVGLELNVGVLRERAHATIAISHASITAPFLLGSLLAISLYPRLSSSDIPFTNFALFLGVAMSITAFPVLARILTDQQMSKTNIGVIALTCAATDDVTAWCLLAFVVGVTQAQVGGALLVTVLTLTYLGFMFVIVQPMIKQRLSRAGEEPLPQGLVPLVFVALFLSALTTEYIGVHAIFGAFLLGAVIPHDSALTRAFTEKLEDLVAVVLLPAFFAFTGMRTQIGLVAGVEQWFVCGMIILVATIGKFGGSLAAARLTGLSWSYSAALGVLMNTRGLMELIVLNIGLDLGIISPTLFAMMVIMAVVTTLATTPVLRLLIPIFACQRGKAATAGGDAASHRIPLSASPPRS